MFAPLVLPIQITFVVLIVMLIGLPVILKRFSKHPVAISFGTTVVFALPLLFLVGAIIDSIRYGEFSYTSADQINDSYVEIPDDSRNIQLFKYASGHRIKFEASLSSLESWMDDVTKSRQSYTDATPFKLSEQHAEISQLEFEKFETYGWQQPADVIKYDGWHSPRGSGYDVWYSPSLETGYIAASYW